MTQLESDTLENLMKNNFAYQKEFFKNDEHKLLQAVYEKLELLEVENKGFYIMKSPLPEKDRVRTDKIFPVQMGKIENVEELKNLYTVLRRLSCLPFELNAKI